MVGAVNNNSSANFNAYTSKAKAGGAVPEKPVKENTPEKPVKENAPEKPADKKDGIGTVNTDEVDAEIQKLKTDQQRARQEVNRAGGDAGKRAAAAQRLAQIEAALSAKDNDGYRKAHARFMSFEA